MEHENTKNNDLNSAPPADGGAAREIPIQESPTDAAPAAEANDLSQEAIEELKLEAAKAKEHWERLLRASADFENYKKRMTRERQETSRYANAGLLEKLIPVLDHFEMALAAAQNTADESVRAFHEGMTMIYQQLRSSLAEAGLEEIDAQGQPFDHNWHEAVSQQASTEVPEGQVLQQLRKGYKLRDRLLRPASVVVAKPPEATVTDGQPAPAES